MLENYFKSAAFPKIDGPDSPSPLKFSALLEDFASAETDFENLFRCKVQPCLLKNDLDSLVQLNFPLQDFEAKALSAKEILESLSLQRIYSNYSKVFDLVSDVSPFFELKEVQTIELFSTLLLHHLLLTFDKT